MVDLADFGFEEEKKPKKRKRTRRPAPPKKDVIVKVEKDETSAVAADAIIKSNESMRQALNELVTKIEPRPKRMKVNINRNSAGFMDSFDIDVEY